MKDQETLKTSALIGQFADSVQYQIDNFLANCVVATSIVVGGVLLASDQLFRVEKLTVGACADLVNDSWLQINKDGSWHVFTSAGLAEKSVERVITTANGFV